MSNNSQMKIKQPEQIIKSMIEKYSKKQDNIVFIEKLFVANTIIKWIFEKPAKTEEILQYLSQVDRYLQGEIDLYWQDGVIKVGRTKKGEK